MPDGNGLLYQELGAELMVYDERRDKVHVLNQTAAEVLRLYREGLSLAEIESRLKERYTVETGQDVGRDISAAVEQMKACNLL